jgi:glutamine cyclotransferase
MSDGTDKIHFLDTTTLKVVKSISVRDERGPVKQVNELEYVDGVIYANVWQTDMILKIDAATGKVIGRLDLTELTKQVKAANPNADVLNGIAWHESTKMLLVTGKYWPYVYVLKLENKKPA